MSCYNLCPSKYFFMNILRPFLFSKRKIMQCNFLFLVPQLQRLLLQININCTHGFHPRISKNNMNIIYIYGLTIRMQYLFFHGELQIFKNLNIVTLNLCCLHIICQSMQSINQLNIDKILLATKVNINNDLFLIMNTTMNL